LFCATHHLSFVSRVRLGVLRWAPPPPVVRILRSMDVTATTCSRVSRSCGCGVVTTTFICRLRPVLDGCWVTPLPIIRVSRSIGVCWDSHYLHPLFASRVQWACAVTTISTLRSRLIAMGVCYPPIVCISLLMGCDVTASSSTHHSHLEFAGCVALTTSRSRLAFNEGLKPPQLLI